MCAIGAETYRRDRSHCTWSRPPHSIQKRYGIVNTMANIRYNNAYKCYGSTVWPATLVRVKYLTSMLRVKYLTRNNVAGQIFDQQQCCRSNIWPATFLHYFINDLCIKNVAGQIFDPQHCCGSNLWPATLLRVEYLTRNIVAGQIFDPQHCCVVLC